LGYLTYILILEETRVTNKKLEPRAELNILVGYETIISIGFIFYQKNIIRLYICLIANLIKEEFILINVTTGIGGLGRSEEYEIECTGVRIYRQIWVPEAPSCRASVEM
jgi:hypothetical protein